MEYLKKLEKLERMDEQEQINYVIKLLKTEYELGNIKKKTRFSHPERKDEIPKLTENIFYYKENFVDVKEEKEQKTNSDRLAVLCIIRKLKNRQDDIGEDECARNYTIFDKNIMKDLEEDELVVNYTDDINFKRMNVIGKKYHEKLYQYIRYSDIYPQIDHKSNNPRINLDNYLRTCNSYYNKLNQRDVHFAKVDTRERKFYAHSLDVSSERREEYIKNGYKIVDFGLYSKEYKRMRDLYRDMKKFEEDNTQGLEGEIFRYDPINDYSYTWYVVVFWKVLGWINKEDADNYQKDFWFRKYENTDEGKEKEKLKELLMRNFYDDPRADMFFAE